jgi:hypothetical protein
MFVCGFLIALGAAWFSRGLWQPAPVVIAPRVIAAGPGAPLTSIAAAMEEARAGDTVEVLAGEYREQVRLKSGVILRSRVPRDASLRAAPMLSNGPAVIAEGVTRARISGFRILADEQIPLSVGIRLVESEVEVEDMEVDRAGVGVEIHGGRVALVGNAVHDCGSEGILILGGTQWLSHNAIQRNKGAGVAARDGARPALIGNVIEKNSLELPAGTDMAPIKERNFLLDAAPRVSPRARPTPPGGKK